MDNVLYRACLLAVILTVATAGRLQAQAPEPGSAEACIALRIADLTNEERDALGRELTIKGDTRIVFACVPAGLILLASNDPVRGMDSLRLRAMPSLLRNVAPDRITEDHLTLRHAEELCALQRGH